MLWIEAVSVALDRRRSWCWFWRATVFTWIRDQLHLRGMTGGGLRLGLVLALFSFVGFESATTLGAEARNPLKTIPRAVMQSAILARRDFSSFARTPKCSASAWPARIWARADAPMHVLADVGGAACAGLADRHRRAGEFVCRTLACITAAARVLLLMAHNGLAHRSLRTTHARNETPSRAILVTGIAAVLPGRDSGGSRRKRTRRLRLDGLAGDVWIHRHLRAGVRRAAALSARSRMLSRPAARMISALACFAMLLALAGNLYPVPEGPYGKLPYIYLVYLCGGHALVCVRRVAAAKSRQPAIKAESLLPPAAPPAAAQCRSP